MISIEKDYYESINIEYIPQSQKIKEFKYSEIYSEEKTINDKIYINKLNCISLDLPEKFISKTNLILLKVKNHSKFFFYDCNLEFNLKEQNSEQNDLIYFLYNFKIGEIKKDNNPNIEKIIKDSITNIQISMIEIQENIIPQKDLNFFEKFNFFLKAIEQSKKKEIFEALSLDTFKEIENIFISKRTKIKFIELINLCKIISKNIEIFGDNSIIIDKYIDLFKSLLNNKLIFFDEINEKYSKEYLSIFDSMKKENEKLYNKFNLIINLFNGYYLQNETLLKYLENKDNCLALSNLYKNNLYEPKSNIIKEKFINILVENSKSLEEFLVIINKNNNITQKMNFIVNYFKKFREIIKESDIKNNIFPIKFLDNLQPDENLNIFASLHKKIVELELNKEMKIKNIFNFYDTIKNYIKLHEKDLETKEVLDKFLILKNIIIEEKKINKESMENLYNYTNKLIHLNLIELAKKNILKDLELLNILKNDEYLFDDLYKITKDDFLILNNFNLKEIFAKKNSDFFKIFKEIKLFKPFCKNKEDTKLYIQSLGDKIDNIIYLELFYEILPLDEFNYHSTEELINWLEKNIKSFNEKVMNEEKMKESFLNSINNLFNLVIKVHYDINKFLSFLEKFFNDDIKHIKNMNINDGFKILNELYLYFINNYKAENNKTIPIEAQNKIISYYVANSEIILDNEYLFISFLNNVIIDEFHLSLDNLLNNLEKLEIKKIDLLLNTNDIKFKILEFLINKYKSEFDNKNNNSNYMIRTRKTVKYFIVKDIEEMNITYNDANIFFNKGINMELNKKSNVNKLVLFSKIKKNQKKIEEKNNEEFYESKYKQLKENYLKCKNVINKLENSIQYFLFFDNENKIEVEEIKKLLNEFNSKKIIDFFSEENKSKLDKYNQIFNLSEKTFILKNSYCFMSIYEEIINNIKDQNNQKINDITKNIESSISNFNELKNLFEIFNENQNDIDNFSHPNIKYFYELELKKGENSLKTEIEFIINYFINNNKEEKELNIFKNFDKIKFIEYIKQITKREKVLIKCKGIKYIINTFMDSIIYINLNIIKKKKQKEKIDIKKDSSNFPDFESLLSKKNSYYENQNKKESINNSNKNINEIINNKINNLLNNSELMKFLNKSIENLENKKILLKDINKIILEIDKYNLGINLNISENQENNNEILLEEFFMKLNEKPETLYFIKTKKYEEIKNIFNDGSIEIENTILKDEDINDFIICIQNINDLSNNLYKEMNDETIKDFPKKIVMEFIEKLNINNNKEIIFLKSLLNYLTKFNQIKLLLNEMIATPEISTKKIKGILLNSDFIIKYDESIYKYIISGKFYEKDEYNNIKEIEIKHEELENLRQRILTINRTSLIYLDALMLQKIFNDMKTVLEILKDMDRTCYPDKFCIIFNIKNKKIYCNYDNQKAFNNIKDVINILLRQKEIQDQYIEKYYEENKIIRLIHGKQLNLLYNYIRYKENKDSVDDLFRLISKGRINASYPPEYQNYSDNLFEDMIKNVSDYMFLVFQVNGINNWYDVLNENEIRINDNQGKKYEGIYLYISPNNNIEKEILNFYRKMANLPLYTTILLCNKYTTEEEIKSFLYRSILCEKNILFMIVNSNHLEPTKRKILLNVVKYLIDKLISEKKKMISTLIISSTDSNSEILRTLKSYNSFDFQIKSLEYKEEDFNNLGNVFIPNINIVQSDSSGVGKSRYIRDVKGSFESNSIYFPLGGNLTRKNIYNRLSDLIKIKKNLTEIFLHIDLNQTNDHEILKEFLFEIIIFKKYSMSSKNSDKLIYINDKYKIYIELPYESIKNDSKNSGNYFKKYSIFSIFNENNIKNISLNNLEKYYEEMSESEKKNLLLNPDFEYVQTISDSRLQLVSKTLDSYTRGLLNDEIIEPNSTDIIDIDNCNILINRYLTGTGTHLPNFYQKNIFINLLSDKFLGFHYNKNLPPDIMIKNAKKLKIENYQKINSDRGFIIYNLITHACTFSKGFGENISKSQERTEEIIQIEDYKKRKELTEELKKREDSHKFRYEEIKPSIISIDRKGKNIKIIPTCKKNSPEDNFLTNLQKLLKVKEKGKIKNEFLELRYPKELSSVELMDELLELIKGRMLSLELITKILSEYALTPDNFIKMILILDRINCDIPVILMGETGCGKTSLIKILANIIFKGNLKENLKILNIHSGIGDLEIIQFIKNIIQESELNDNMKMISMKDVYNSMSKEQKEKYLNDKKVNEETLFIKYKKKLEKEKVWVFFDEINSCNSMGLLAEIFTKRTYFGQKIPKKFVFLAACNPYRPMGEMNKIDYTLIHKDQEKRKLVYTVYPLPQNLLNFVLDFGNLTLDEEKKYIQIMVRKMMEKIMIDKEKSDTSKIIDIAINSILSCQSYIKSTNDVSAVSLREVKRFILFFKYFVVYLLNKKNTKDLNDHSIKFYNSKTNYEIYKYAVILSLYICYYLKLPDNKSRIDLLSILEKNNIFQEKFLLVPELEMDYVARNILESKENESLSKGIAKNKALLENLFSLYFCTVNKIPLIICGKPGSTKSLSQKLLQNALKGIASNTKLCKETKELVVFPYQGSLNSTAEEIKSVFKKAKNYQKNNNDTIVMVCFEEMGLAEINKNNPLKVIHSELEINFDFEISDDFEQNLFSRDDNTTSKIAFFGTSNWSLDASKMNRVIFNILQEPDKLINILISLIKLL